MNMEYVSAVEKRPRNRQKETLQRDSLEESCADKVQEKASQRRRTTTSVGRDSEKNCSSKKKITLKWNNYTEKKLEKPPLTEVSMRQRRCMDCSGKPLQKTIKGR